MDWKIERIIVPVSDVDASIAIGQGISDTAPGFMRGVQVVVADAAQARLTADPRGIRSRWTTLEMYASGAPH